MNDLCFTQRDYTSYLQMSNRRHLLAEDEADKATLGELLAGEEYVDLDVDNVSFMICFDRPYTKREKLNAVFSDAVRFPYATKVVRAISSSKI